jgi:hypothetical protein
MVLLQNKKRTVGNHQKAKKWELFDLAKFFEDHIDEPFHFPEDFEV